MIATDVLLREIRGMTHSEVRNYVVPGLTSSLVGGGKGQVRLFTSDRDTREWVTPHSHRFDFTCLVLAGEVENIVFHQGRDAGSNLYARGTVRRVGPGLGAYEIRRSDEPPTEFYEIPTTYRAGEVYSMASRQIH